MAGPLLLAPLAAKAAPWVLGVVGSMLPVIVDAFRTGKSPEEAAKIVEPKRQEIIDRLVGTGMNRSAAEVMANESIKGELEKAKLPEPMNPWLSAALSIVGLAAGAYGGAKLGKRLGGTPPVDTEASAATTPQAQSSPKISAGKNTTPSEDVYRPGFESPEVARMRSGSMDRVVPVTEGRGGNLPYTPTDERGVIAGAVTEGPFPSRRRGDLAAEIIGDTGNIRSAPVTVEGPFPRMAERGDLLSAPYDPRLIGVSDVERKLDLQRMRQRMYRTEGD